LVARIAAGASVVVAEEHVRQGGFASQLLLYLAERQITVGQFHHMYARAHHFERYGSQTFLRCQSQLDSASLLSVLAGL
jgi:transketolase